MQKAKNDYLSEDITKILVNTFIVLGLSDQHAHAYLANLVLGKIPASYIAKKTKVPRSTTYALLEELESWGLIEKSNSVRTSKTLYACSNPNNIKRLLNYQRERINELSYKVDREIYILESIYSQNFTSPKQPEKLTKNNIDALVKNLVDKGRDNKYPIYLWVKKLEDEEQLEIINKILINSRSIQIKIKLLLPFNIEPELYDGIEKNKETLIRFSISFYTSKNTIPLIILTRKGTIYLDVNDEKTLVIEDKDVTVTQREAFDQIWETSSNSYEP